MRGYEVILLCVAVMADWLVPVNSLTDEERQVFISYGCEMTAGPNHNFSSNGMPTHAIGPFPSADNPNEAIEQQYTATFPETPTSAEEPGCLDMGAIGYAVNGVALFNPYSAWGTNAVEGTRPEVFDDCDGHPQEQGAYHYHKISSCLLEELLQQYEEEEFIYGVAMDGHPIYVTRDGTASDLDDCHGKMVDSTYRYYATYDFPYYLACYNGIIPEGNVPHGPPSMQGGEGPPMGGRGEGPPMGGAGRPPMDGGDDGMRGGGQGGDRSPPGCVIADIFDPSGWEDFNGSAVQHSPLSTMSLVALVVATVLANFIA